MVGSSECCMLSCVVCLIRGVMSYYEYRQRCRAESSMFWSAAANAEEFPKTSSSKPLMQRRVVRTRKALHIHAGRRHKYDPPNLESIKEESEDRKGVGYS